MYTINKNNYISIAKAIGITLMVVGHSGSPLLIEKFIYLFHMPLFIVCSGFFFNDVTESIQLRQFCIKKFKGLYFPYLKWSILFLLLHNTFYFFHIYEQPYYLNDFFRNLGKALFMTDFEILLRPFWFLKALLLASIIVAGITFLKNKYQLSIRHIELLVTVLLITLLFKLLEVHFPIMGDPSIISFSMVYFLSGILIRKYEQRIPCNIYAISIELALLLLGCGFFPGIIDMRYTNVFNLFIYFLLSITGIFFVFNISKIIQERGCYTFNNILYYVGSNTMSILALNLFALRIGNFIKIEIYQLPIDKMSSHTIISEYNDYFWLLYTILGISIPLLLNYLYKKLYQFINNNI